MMLHPFIPFWLMVGVTVIVLGFMIWFLLRKVHRHVRRWYIRAGAIGLLIVLMWHPVGYGGNYQSSASMTDVYFVVDVTQSMAAEDYNGTKTRLEGVRQDIHTIVTQLAGARYSVISFSNIAMLELPLTTDASAAVASADSLTPVMYLYAKGSSPSTPLTMLETQLKNDQRDHPDRQRVVYYFSDGETTGGAVPASFKPVRTYISAAKILGYGTTTGGRMKESIYTYSGETSSTGNYLKDPVHYSDDALSKINDAALQSIANDLDGTYIYREKPDDGQRLIEGLDPARSVKSEEGSQVSAYIDFSWLIALPLLGILGWEGWLLLDERSRARAMRGGIR